MNSSTWSFLIKFEAILDAVIYDWKIEFFLLPMIQFGHKQSFNEKRKPYISCFLVSGYDKVVIIASSVASDTTSITLLSLEGNSFGTKISYQLTTS